MTQTDTKIDKVLQLDKKAKETLTAILISKTMTEAAGVLKISRGNLYERIDRYGLRKYIDELPTKALDVLRLGSIQAAEVFVGALEERGNKMEAAKEILDRVGVSNKTPTTAVQINNIVSDKRKDYGF